MTSRLRARAVVCLSGLMASTGLGLAGLALLGPGRVVGPSGGGSAGDPAASGRPVLESEVLDPGAWNEVAGPPTEPAEPSEGSDRAGRSPGSGTSAVSDGRAPAVGSPGTAAGGSSGAAGSGSAVGVDDDVGAVSHGAGGGDGPALHAPLLDHLTGPGHRPDGGGSAGADVRSPLVADEPSVVSGLGLDPVAREILRLTNALRADPAGLLAREKPLPSCTATPYYQIEVDPETGQPVPVPPLVLDEEVSLVLARSWAREMDRTGAFEHRPVAEAKAVYDRLGIDQAATGENIAWLSGYSDVEAARIHFEGWRESDDGHYCALVSPTYTHVGVGVYRGEERAWAVQNFYQAR